MRKFTCEEEIWTLEEMLNSNHSEMENDELGEFARKLLTMLVGEKFHWQGDINSPEVERIE